VLAGHLCPPPRKSASLGMTRVLSTVSLSAQMKRLGGVELAGP
jgi:hypothetical protein